MKSFKSRRKGFTLIEVLLVIGILAVLSTVAVIGFTRIREKAIKDTTKLLVDETAKAVEHYALHMNKYPDTDDGLNALISRPDDDAEKEKWGGPYLQKGIPVDPWGNELKYEKVDRDEDATGPGFKVFSYGPDGQEGTDDDIASYKEKD